MTLKSHKIVTLTLLFLLITYVDISAQRFKKRFFITTGDERGNIDKINDSTFCYFNTITNGFRIDTVNQNGQVSQGATYLRPISCFLSYYGTKKLADGSRLVYGMSNNTGPQ